MISGRRFIQTVWIFILWLPERPFWGLVGEAASTPIVTWYVYHGWYMPIITFLFYKVYYTTSDIRFFCILICVWLLSITWHIDHGNYITSKLWALIALFGVVLCCWWMMTNCHIWWLTVICHLWGHVCPLSLACLSFVCGWLHLLYPDTLGVPFPPLGGLPPTGDLSVRRPRFAMLAVSQ